MSSDGNLRPIFREKLREGFHWQSIETGVVGVGTPDSNFCCAGVEGWIEFKQTKKWGVTLRPDQIGWLVRRSMVGGHVFVAVRRWQDTGSDGLAVDELWLYSGEWARELRTHGLNAPIPRLGLWVGGPRNWDWDQVRWILLQRRP